MMPTKEKRQMIPVGIALHRRLKIKAAREGRGLREVAEEALQSALRGERTPVAEREAQG